MANSYGQFTLWVSVSYVVKSEPSCTSHKPRASYQSWLVRGDLVHGICPHAATQSYKVIKCLLVNLNVRIVFKLLTTKDIKIFHECCCYWFQSSRCKDLQLIEPAFVNEIIDFLRFSYACWPDNIRKFSQVMVVQLIISTIEVIASKLLTDLHLLRIASE